MRAIWTVLAAVALMAPISAQADENPAFKEYVMSLFSVPGKALTEFSSLATASPLLTSYAMALFTDDRCTTPHASDALIEAAGGDEAFETEAGKRVFAVTGVVATMTYPTAADEASFCESARKLVQTSENYVAGHK